MKKYILALIFLVSIVAYGNDPPASKSFIKAVASPAMAGEQITWQVIASGGNHGTSTNYVVTGVVGQTAAGSGNSTGYNLLHGFLQNFGSASCCATPGDADNNGSVNILDVSKIINWKYKGAAAPVCQSQADADGNGAVNILDVSRIINWKYKGGIPAVCGHID
ncbi:exported hypothetical protein [Candidatus Zixiibacteriota bacterium]|nr:exported hypothetical protein [candidate division Zixibacteria bacterium]